MSIITIDYPPPNFKYKIQDNKRFIFCLVRKRYLVLTPEEWVRQNFIAYLIEVAKYPRNLISVEKRIKVGNVFKRYDIVIYNQEFVPEMLVECKQPDVEITQETLYQLINYNKTLGATYWILTNGNKTFCGQIHTGRVEWMNRFPTYIQVSN